MKQAIFVAAIGFLSCVSLVSSKSLPSSAILADDEDARLSVVSLCPKMEQI